MSDYFFTDLAEHDLEKIIDYTVDQWGGLQATQYIDGLERQAQILAENPDIGLDAKLLSAGLLSFPYQSHILYYMKISQDIAIIRILHNSMDPAKHTLST